MSDTDVAGAPAMSEAETQYFESGGETELPSTELDTLGDTESTGDGDNAGEGDGGQKQEQGEKNKTVPHGALHEERERRKAADKRARDLELENVKFRERFSLLEKLQAPKQEDKPPPNPEEDIFGAYEHLNKQLAEVQKKLNDGEQAQTHDRQVGELVNHYRNDAAQFESTTPDFKDAYNFLIQSRARELMELGYETKAELEAALSNEEVSIATLAFQKGRSPAATIYKLAVERGYKKADSKADTEARLDTIERGAGLNKSLSSAGGGAGDGEMTAERLLSMPNEEFEAWCDKNPTKARRLMGA